MVRGIGADISKAAAEAAATAAKRSSRSLTYQRNTTTKAHFTTKAHCIDGSVEKVSAVMLAVF